MVWWLAFAGLVTGRLVGAEHPGRASKSAWSRAEADFATPQAKPRHVAPHGPEEEAAVMAVHKAKTLAKDLQAYEDAQTAKREQAQKAKEIAAQNKLDEEHRAAYDAKHPKTFHSKPPPMGLSKDRLAKLAKATSEANAAAHGPDEPAYQPPAPPQPPVERERHSLRMKKLAEEDAKKQEAKQREAQSAAFRKTMQANVEELRKAAATASAAAKEKKVVAEQAAKHPERVAKRQAAAAAARKPKTEHLAPLKTARDAVMDSIEDGWAKEEKVLRGQQNSGIVVKNH